jgi:hypothetical protein
LTDRWLDEDAGPIVRPYTMTRGRTRPSGADFDLIAIVTTVTTGDPAGLAPEHLSVLRACLTPNPVAEIASETGLALAVVRVLLGDLRDRGLVLVRPPAMGGRKPREHILREVLQGLDAL